MSVPVQHGYVMNYCIQLVGCTINIAIEIFLIILNCIRNFCKGSRFHKCNRMAQSFDSEKVAMYSKTVPIPDAHISHMLSDMYYNFHI